MKVVILPTAHKTIQQIVAYIEDINTEGSGIKWSERFYKEISKYAQPIKYALCRHKFWANKKFHCFALKNWVIIFKIEDDIFYVYRIIHASTFR